MEKVGQFPHRRWNPLRQSWVMVSPHRTQRPWQGEVGQAAVRSGVAYDPECYLCPGNTRAGGEANPSYDSVFSFVNDYAALLPDPRADEITSSSPLLISEPARGLCKVLCFHPDHSLTLARMTRPEIRLVVDAWAGEYEQLAQIDWIRYVQIFENRGAMMGASNPHPHCQMWATGFVPDEPAVEVRAQREHRDRTGHCLLCSYLATERASGERVVMENDYFAVVVPWWAVWPFEVILLSKRHLGALSELTRIERDALADALKRLTTRYDNLFETSFPYTMGFHQSPTDHEPHPEMHFHGHFYPPLLRSATVRKFMVGFEMLGMPQRDITPESAAERLRACSETHYWPRD
ncbi:MAG TPA: UDP-glucose--hexose-1-phosphate uridylyltransferase [Terracidiphilus sp.]|jgi:UDPglucose--hexose-1-phosphate uridylyltransferase|nr:UDP-glucose--hexose-1-phosphate uridylyltransferase [Terracidiphilus sp.]